MTYEEAKPFTDKLYELAMWYHAKPNEFRKRVYEVIDDIAKAEREACAVIAETPIYGEQDDITMEAKDRVAKAIRARSNT
jgi:hypothetical protein